MNRRALLHALAAGGGVGCAGCTGGRTGGDDSPETSTSSTAVPYRVLDRTFAAISNNCGTPVRAVDASLDPDPSATDASEYVLTIGGVIAGNDSCHRARLASLDAGSSGGTMTVGVETYVADAEPDAVCLECLVAIEYELVVTIAGGRPETVLVTHDGERAGEVTLSE